MKQVVTVPTEAEAITVRERILEAGARGVTHGPTINGYAVDFEADEILVIHKVDGCDFYPSGVVSPSGVLGTRIVDG